MGGKQDADLSNFEKVPEFKCDNNMVKEKESLH